MAKGVLDNEFAPPTPDEYFQQHNGVENEQEQEQDVDGNASGARGPQFRKSTGKVRQLQLLWVQLLTECCETRTYL